MQKLNLTIIISLISFLISSCQHQEKTVVKSTTFTVVQEDPGPLPDSVIDSRPITLKHWFSILSNAKKYEKLDLTYKFELIKTNNFYDLKDLSKDVQQYYQVKNINPYGKYSTIVEAEYPNLSLHQVLEKMKYQLKAYSQTEEFKHSSLAKAKSISIKFDDETLISLK
jgi:hypothetical protein